MSRDAQRNFKMKKGLCEALALDIEKLSPQSVELVAAVVSVQAGLPSELIDKLLDLLGQRFDLTSVSPAAQAAMQIALNCPGIDIKDEVQMKQSAYELLRVLKKDRYLDEAIQFLPQIANRVFPDHQLRRPEHTVFPRQMPRDA